MKQKILTVLFVLGFVAFVALGLLGQLELLPGTWAPVALVALGVALLIIAGLRWPRIFAMVLGVGRVEDAEKDVRGQMK